MRRAPVKGDLWDGADVRWMGPERRRRGFHLRRGDSAVVVDAGRHRLTSYSPLVSTISSGRSLRGVAIRLADGTIVRVARRHLEIVAPDHPLSPEPDGTVASWWLDRLAPWDRHHIITVASMVPSTFPAVARLSHPGGLAGELDESTATVLVEVLGAATITPADVFVAVWSGWGDVPRQRFPGAAHLDTEARGHFLLRGPLTGVLTPIAVSPIARPVAGLWWPADRAWFLATEIDFAWTFIAGSDALINRLVGDQRLNAVRTRFQAPAGQTADPSDNG